MTAREATLRAAQLLAAAGIETPRVDAELLVAHVLHATRTELTLDGVRRLSPEERATLEALLERRERREPLAYILGEWGFRRLTLRVDRRALIPRPETEIVVERCLALIRGLAAPDVLDVGVGSGAIALAIADEHPGARVTAIDNSPDALALAAENLAATGLGSRVRLVRADLRSGFGPARYDLIVSNPPYVSEPELEELAPEVRDWEPRVALVGSGHTEAVIASARAALKPGGVLVLELAGRERETTRVADALRRGGFTELRVTRDLAGRDRVIECR